MLSSSSTLLKRVFFHYITILCFVSFRSVGFTIPLIPRFSEESPFYRGNLTTHQKIHDLIKISLARQYFRPKQNMSSPDNIRVPLHGPSEHAMYVTKLSIGTPPSIQTLILDTGSGMVWTQCKGCYTCFNQTTPMYDPTQSSSYQKFPPVLPLCKNEHYKIVDGDCKFQVTYLGGPTVSGMVSREKFTFDQVGGGQLVFNDMIFGCATESSKDLSFVGGEVSGMVGLTPFQHSLSQQFSSMIQGRFSYCLKEGLNISTVMKFGEDVVMPSGLEAKSIPFVNQIYGDHYYLELVDISVGELRLRFGAGTFKLREDGSRGCVIDSGSGVSYIQEGPYDNVIGHFDLYYMRHNFRKVRRHLMGLDLEFCYKIDPNFHDYIGMTFHFENGADFFVKSKYLYFFDEEFFCITLFPSREATIIGSWQQQNLNIVYDMNNQMLHFEPDPCNG